MVRDFSLDRQRRAAIAAINNSLLGEGKAAIMLQHDSTTAINLKN